MVDITIGTKSVVASGSFITFEDEPSKLSFKISGEVFTFEFCFLDEGDSSKVETEGIDNKTLKLKFYNFKSSLGTSNNKPFRLGNINDKPLYLNAVISKYNSNSKNRKINYTFYLEDDHE